MKVCKQVMVMLLILCSCCVQAAELYVSPTGNDKNDGTQKSPLATIEGARRQISKQELAGKEPVTVWVQAGTYHMSEPLRLQAKDSGSAEAPITYRAVPGDEVVLKGSLPLNPKAWKPWKDGIYQQSLKGTPLEGREINQLFMSNKCMIRARFPNWDFDNPLRTGKGYLHAGGKSTTMTQMEWRSGDLEARVVGWKNLQSGIVHIFHSKNWGNYQFQIKDIEPSTRTLYFSRGGWQAQRRERGISGAPYYIENIFEELDAEFEWFHDAQTDTLYFKPSESLNLADVAVEAVVTRRIIKVVGVKHVHFQGLHLTQTRATFMDAYEDIARGDWAIHRGGAVYFLNSQNCTVKDFHIEQVGGNGIFVDGFNREIHISGCLIEDTGDSAVCFVGNPKAVREYQTWVTGKKEGTLKDLEPGPKTEDYPANCSVKNTITRDVGVYGKQTSGVLVSMAMDITIDHCSVYRIARAGITFNDGTWGGHVMSNCDIYDTILDTGEHGPFNSWGRERFWNGSRMNKDWVLLDAMKTVKLYDNRIGNYRSGISAGNWTIDLDDGSCNFEIYNNLMLGSTLKLRDGFYRTVTNNIMVSAVPTGLHVWPKDNSEDVFKHNITVVAGGAEGGRGRSANILGDIRMPADTAAWGTFDKNLWWNVNSKAFKGRGQIKSFQEWQQKQGKNSVMADPQFVDPFNRNYRVKETSPALALGFKNFPMEHFGHQMTRIMNSMHDFEGECWVEIRPDARGGQVRYTLDGSAPSATLALYTKPIKITETTTVTASTFNKKGLAVGFADSVVFTKVKKVVLQSWLASTLAGEYLAPVGALAKNAAAVKSEPIHWAGMTLVNIAEYPDSIDASGGQTTGAFVTKLDPTSKAAAAGFKNGDTIIRVGSKEVRDLADLKAALKSASGSVTCTVFRGYKHYELIMKPDLDVGARDKRPNILFIIADDQSPFDLKVYDAQSSLETPVIDRLAAEGMVIDGAHQMGAWCGGVCTPSRHMIMSGRTLWHIPDKPRMGRSPLEADPNHVPPDLAEYTMASVFNAAGYDTMRTCKKGNSYSAANQKFTVIHDSTKRGGTDETGSAWHAKQVLKYLEQREAANDEDPFMIYFGFSHPHDVRDGKSGLLAKYGAVNHRDKNSLPLANPKQPQLPPNYLPGHPFDNTDMNVRDETRVSGVWTNRDERTIRNELGREFACSENIDIQIGTVLKKLEEMGELENTYIFYTSDHGIAIGRHGLQGKQNLYEHTFRVPYIVKGPGIKPGSRVMGNIYHLDALATLCDLAGIDAPKTSEGISFRSVLEGKKDAVRDLLYGAYCGGAKPGMRCVKKGDWKLIRYESTKDGVSETQLFNLAENPHELVAEHHAPKVIAMTKYQPKAHETNLANDPKYANKLAEMEQLLLAEMRSHYDPYRFFNQPDDGLTPPVIVEPGTKSRKPRAASSEAPYDGSWESLQKMPVPAWFEDGKIGIFIHWGPYSVIGYKKGGAGYAEHVPKLIYEESKHYYPYVKERWGANPPEFGYKDIIPEFKAENWNPDEWATLFADVGAKYVVLTAEHHDGWANWDSDLTPWNAVDKGPKRDLVGDLGKAVRAKGLKYAPSYHRERHTGFFAKDKYKVYSEPRPDIAEEIKRVPEAAMLYGPEFSYNKAFVDGYVARWKEIQRKYQPDMLWVDDFPIYTRDGNKVRDGKMRPEIKYFDDEVRAMITDFMNEGAARGADVYLNNKGGNKNWPAGVGCLEKDNLKLKVIGPKWESCTTFGTSYGYLAAEEAPDYKRKKTVKEVIHNMVEIISRNGNFLINIGPKADGTIPAWQVERLRGMGDWLKINGDALYGTRYWKAYAQENEDLAFTTKGKTLYAIMLAKPASLFTIEATAGWKKNQVKSVKLLGSKASVTWEMTPAGLQITPPSDLGASQHAWSFEIVTTESQHHPKAIQADATKALKGTAHVDLDGHVSPNAIRIVPILDNLVVEIETASSASGFSKCPLPALPAGTVMANPKTSNDPLASLTDGKLAASHGPVFRNGIRNGAYKMDLGAVKPVSAITSWSHQKTPTRAAQKINLYGSSSPTDPGWDLSKLTPLGTIDTTGSTAGKFNAASLRAPAGKSLGTYRWIVWAVSPVSSAGGGGEHRLPGTGGGVMEESKFSKLSLLTVYARGSEGQPRWP